MNTLKTDSNIYYKNSQIYDNFSQAQDYGDLIIQEISKIVKGDVLDFGCGTGKIILKLLEKNLDISLTGLDISENQLDIPALGSQYLRPNQMSRLKASILHVVNECGP